MFKSTINWTLLPDLLGYFSCLSVQYCFTCVLSFICVWACLHVLHVMVCVCVCSPLFKGDVILSEFLPVTLYATCCDSLPMICLLSIPSTLQNQVCASLALLTKSNKPVPQTMTWQNTLHRVSLSSTQRKVSAQIFDGLCLLFGWNTIEVVFDKFVH